MGKRGNCYGGREGIRKLLNEDFCECCCKCNHCHEKHEEKVKDEAEDSPSNTNSFKPTFNPSIMINVFNTPSPRIGVETFQYITTADEGKKVYTNQEALKQYGSSEIPDPNDVSYMNLFINGVLQPEIVYEVKKGSLLLKSSDSPPSGAPIILLFVVIKE
ncbi:DUF4183 domain-containing protein [Halobacillus shinanisalinarum]|uniref:DUF4183 domain-containing protein n=1 Tax=Halobacillus shinanisalinarum TaxID=2932258 RepID=A0ABY4GXL8_9BACI|nr:DUF4183 domain-containing protein [Halobacillus shinanisalinarum]UOQ92162.1 DUF4183 domain-containing protein [Halobacillus shinanisalinarum]